MDAGCKQRLCNVLIWGWVGQGFAAISHPVVQKKRVWALKNAEKLYKQLRNK